MDRKIKTYRFTKEGQGRDSTKDLRVKVENHVVKILTKKGFSGKMNYSAS